MAAQEMFDTVASHLLTQGMKSKRFEGGCMYRSGKLRCAAGCLLPDDVKVVEGCSADSGRMRAVFREIVGEGNISLLTGLQCTHDFTDPSDWQEDLDDCAIRYNLLPYPRMENRATEVTNEQQ